MIAAKRRARTSSSSPSRTRGRASSGVALLAASSLLSCPSVVSRAALSPIAAAVWAAPERARTPAFGRPMGTTTNARSNARSNRGREIMVSMYPVPVLPPRPRGSGMRCPVSRRGSRTEKEAMTETELEANAEEYSSTVPDEKADNPASLVFYDDVPSEVVCARGVCVLDDDDDDDDADDGIAGSKDESSLVDRVLNSYLGPRALLAFASVLYGTNFPLGTMMNDALPPSAATSARMVLASLALSPFLPKLDRSLSATAALCGCFTALGYISQSLSLVDTSPATVAFLGAATVVVCPTLEVLVNKRPMGFRDAPQVWLAAALCLTGVGVLELYDPSGGNAVAGAAEAGSALSRVGWGDVLAILQAVGFGTSFFITERMMRGRPDQALPITAAQVSVTALLCMIWCVSDGWIGTVGSENYGLPGMFTDPSLRTAAGAVAWTGLITTAMNRFVETTSLGKVSSAEASVILATEPLWAALFAALWLHDDFGTNDYLGGFLIVAACVANTLKPTDFNRFFGDDDDELEGEVEVREQGRER